MSTNDYFPFNNFRNWVIATATFNKLDTFDLKGIRIDSLVMDLKKVWVKKSI
jgi:hypothetical protein